MKKLEGYMAGVNLGGWLSQYLEGNLQRDPEHHFDRFITKEDIDRIADFGFLVFVADKFRQFDYQRMIGVDKQNPRAVKGCFLLVVAHQPFQMNAHLAILNRQ